MCLHHLAGPWWCRSRAGPSEKGHRYLESSLCGPHYPQTGLRLVGEMGQLGGQAIVSAEELHGSPPGQVPDRFRIGAPLIPRPPQARSSEIAPGNFMNSPSHLTNSPKSLFVSRHPLSAPDGSSVGVSSSHFSQGRRPPFGGARKGSNPRNRIKKELSICHLCCLFLCLLLCFFLCLLLTHHHS